MDKIQKIKSKIGKLKSEYNKESDFRTVRGDTAREVLDKLLSFIDSIPEEPASDDLEAEIQRYFREEKWIKKPVEEIAIHFANWQHGKDFDDLLQSEMKFPKEYYEKGKADAMKEMKEALQTEYEKGRFDMREEMMKDAINGIMDCDDDNEWIEITDKLIVTPSRAGNKVKIIIIKPEQQ